MRALRVLAILSLSGLSAALIAAGQATQSGAQQASPAQSSYVLKVRTRLVTLDVIATDSQGNPVRDLTADELQVFEERNKRQNISSFEFIDTAANAAAARQRPAYRGRTSTPTSWPRSSCRSRLPCCSWMLSTLSRPTSSVHAPRCSISCARCRRIRRWLYSCSGTRHACYRDLPAIPLCCARRWNEPWGSIPTASSEMPRTIRIVPPSWSRMSPIRSSLISCCSSRISRRSLMPVRWTCACASHSILWLRLPAH